MTKEQRALVNGSANIIIFSRRSHPPRATDPGPTTWAWLRGLFVYEGQLTVAAQYLFRFDSKAQKEAVFRDEDCMREWEGETIPWREGFERELNAAGRIGQEVYHCQFESGPWSA